MWRTILVPLDCSLKAEGILSQVEEIARPNKATVILLHVVELGPVRAGPWASMLVLPPEDHLKEDGVVDLYLSAIEKGLRDKGVDARSIVAHGRNVADTIVRTAKANGADVIAVTGQRRTCVFRALSGDVVSGIARRIDRETLLLAVFR